MVHWQLIILFTLLITAICASWPEEEDGSKICLHFTGSYNGDSKCSNYCKSQGKSGGFCIRKRCICHNNDEDGEENKKPTKPKQQINSRHFLQKRNRMFNLQWVE